MKRSFEILWFKFLRCNRRAFTLVEIFLVIALLSAISIVIYNAFSSGLKIWERARGSLAEEDIMIFFDKVSQDLRNSFAYSKIRFEGTKENISFATIVHTPVDAKKAVHSDEYVPQIGQVEYYFDRPKEAVCRRQANYSQALNRRFLKEYVLAKAISALKFRYYYRSGNGYVSQEASKDILPCLIKIEVQFKDRSKHQRNLVKLIDIPVGS